MRPGKPLLSGQLGAMRVIGLPGNPVSAYVCSAVFLAPLLRRLSGRPDGSLAAGDAVLGRDLKENDERADYLRAALVRGDDGVLVATPFPQQDSSMLVPLAAADCLVIREPFQPAAKAGEPCRFLPLEE
jgi:molybdopterin molybdotransferase